MFNYVASNHIISGIIQHWAFSPFYNSGPSPSVETNDFGSPSSQLCLIILRFKWLNSWNLLVKCLHMSSVSLNKQLHVSTLKHIHNTAYICTLLFLNQSPEPLSWQCWLADNTNEQSYLSIHWTTHNIKRQHSLKKINK